MDCTRLDSILLHFDLFLYIFFDKLNRLETKVDVLSARVYRIKVLLGKLRTISEGITAKLGRKPQKLTRSVNISP